MEKTATRFFASRGFREVSGIGGTYIPPSDKSITHRAIMLASVAEGWCEVINPLYTGDCLSTLGCVEALGIEIEKMERNDKRVLRILGKGLHGFKEPVGVLDAGNSGTTMRLLSGLLAGLPLYAVITGDSSLLRRPMSRVVSPLRSMGARIEGREGGRFAPLTFLPGDGLLEPIEYDLPIASAQVKSAVLLAALRSKGIVVVKGLINSRDHTERLFKALDLPIEVEEEKIILQPVSEIPPFKVEVPGDISSAAFFIAGALLSGRELTVKNCGINPTRMGFVNVLKKMGASIEIVLEKEEMGEPVGTITVSPSNLRGVEIGKEEIPSLIDEIPLLVAVALFADGKTVIRGAEDLKHKESNRLLTTKEMIEDLGGVVHLLEDGFIVEGPQDLKTGTIDCKGDHRIAMAGAILGSVVEGGVNIVGFEAAKVSYPSFVSDFIALGGAID